MTTDTTFTVYCALPGWFAPSVAPGTVFQLREPSVPDYGVTMDVPDSTSWIWDTPDIEQDPAPPPGPLRTDH